MSDVTTLSADSNLDELGLSDAQRKRIEEQREKLDELRASGALVLVLPSGDIVAFRKMDRITWKQFKARRENDKQKHEVDEWLCGQLVVHPSKAGFEAILDEKPARSLVFMQEILTANGLEKDEAKKL